MALQIESRDQAVRQACIESQNSKAEKHRFDLMFADQPATNAARVGSSFGALLNTTSLCVVPSISLSSQCMRLVSPIASAPRTFSFFACTRQSISCSFAPANPHSRTSSRGRFVYIPPPPANTHHLHVFVLDPPSPS